MKSMQHCKVLFVVYHTRLTTLGHKWGDLQCPKWPEDQTINPQRLSPWELQFRIPYAGILFLLNGKNSAASNSPLLRNKKSCKMFLLEHTGSVANKKHQALAHLLSLGNPNTQPQSHTDFFSFLRISPCREERQGKGNRNRAADPYTAERHFQAQCKMLISTSLEGQRPSFLEFKKKNQQKQICLGR